MSLHKINTEGFPNPTTHTELNNGVSALRRVTTTTATGVNRKHLLEHPLVKEAVAYWQGALDVVNEANCAKVASQVRKFLLVWIFVLPLFAQLMHQILIFIFAILFFLPFRPRQCVVCLSTQLPT